MNAEQIAMDLMLRNTEAQERQADAIERIAAAIECFTAEVVEEGEPESEGMSIDTDMAGRPIN